MQNLQLGDYRGGRDTLQTAMTQQYSPLEHVQAAAQAFGQQGMANAAGARMQKSRERAELGKTMLMNEAAIGLEGLRSENEYKKTMDYANKTSELQGLQKEKDNAFTLSSGVQSSNLAREREQSLKNLEAQNLVNASDIMYKKKANLGRSKMQLNHTLAKTLAELLPEGSVEKERFKSAIPNWYPNHEDFTDDDAIAYGDQVDTRTDPTILMKMIQDIAANKNKFHKSKTNETSPKPTEDESSILDISGDGLDVK